MSYSIRLRLLRVSLPALSGASAAAGACSLINRGWLHAAGWLTMSVVGLILGVNEKAQREARKYYAMRRDWEML